MSEEDKKAMSEEKKKLTSKRAGHKAYATRVMKEATALCGSPNVANRAKLNTFLKALSDRKDIIAGLDEEVLSFLEPDDFEAEILSSGDYQMNIDETIFTITEALDSLSASDDTKNDLNMPDLEDIESAKKTVDKNLNKSSDDSCDSQVGYAKLPKLQLPHFSGEILMFQEFWESFESAVDKDPKLDKIMKFTYLRSLLEDDAASVISGLSLTASNYDVALSLLQDRFANKQVLISSHIDQLLNLPTVTTSLDTTKLRHLYDRIEKNVRCLKNLDVSSVHYGPILLQIVMKKIPDDIQLIVSRAMSNALTNSEDTEGRSGDTWEIDELIKAFKREIESREMCNFIGSSPSGSYSSSSLFTGARAPPPRNELQQKNPAQQCLFCDKKHATWKCNTVTEITARKEILK